MRERCVGELRKNERRESRASERNGGRGIEEVRGNDKTGSR